MIKKFKFITLLVLILSSCTTVSSDTETDKPKQRISAATVKAWAGQDTIIEGYIYDSTHNFDQNAVPYQYKLDKNYKTGWKGETISFTTAFFSSYNLEDVKLKVAGLPQGIKQDDVTILVAEYTKAYSDLSADPLFPRTSFNLNKDTIAPIWIKINIPANLDAGNYKFDLIAEANFNEEAVSKKIDLELRVQDYTLAAPSEWGFTLDLWQNPFAVARFHEVELWGEQHIELLKEYLDILANAGQKQITTSIIDKPWNGQTYDPFQSMIVWTKKKDGSFEFDYSIFDLWVQLAKDAGIKGMINCYTMIPWHDTFVYFDEAKNQDIILKTKPGTKKFEALWKPFLNDFERHLAEKGWLDHTNIAMDERPEALMNKVVSFLHKEAPNLGISSAYNYIPKISDDIFDFSISIDYTHVLPAEWKEDRVKKGMHTTFYICTWPRKPNTFTISKPAEAQWLGIHSFKQDLTGILRWAYNSWPVDPFDCSDYGLWPPGDTYLVYPGPITSIRFEKFRDGIEEYEKLKVLERDYPEKFAYINEYVKDFEYTRDVDLVIKNLNAYLDALENL